MKTSRGESGETCDIGLAGAWNEGHNRRNQKPNLGTVVMKNGTHNFPGDGLYGRR